MVQFHPFRDVTKENIRGSPNFGSEKTVELFCGKLLWGGGVLPYKGLIGMCRWMGSHFHDWSDYHGVEFSIELLEWGRKFSDFWGK